MRGHPNPTPETLNSLQDIVRGVFYSPLWAQGLGVLQLGLGDGDEGLGLCRFKGLGFRV